MGLKLRCEHALLPAGLQANVALEVGADGRLVAVGEATGEERSLQGLVLPGMPNLHSHAFQRAMAGNAEAAGGGAGDSFWGWRERMYALAAHVDEDALASIAAFAYLEMLEAGYTEVAEFHYLHGAAQGAPAQPPLAMARALREGARLAGIRQLLLPTLYQRGGFDGRALAGAQRRFELATGQLLALRAELAAGAQPLQSTGLALHSLRAVAPEAVREVARAARAAGCPLHLHVAEQPLEVGDCLATLGRRPIEWLLEQGLVEGHWCLVHATHATEAELRGAAATGAVAGLCPTTEANLGDGVFPLAPWLAAGGRLGIGSDSQVALDPREELRSLEYSLRLAQGQRTRVADASEPHVGNRLWQLALAGGGQACGGTRGLVVGAPADFLVIDIHRAEFAGVEPGALLDAWLLAPRPGALREAWVGGQAVVRDGQHVARDAIARRYRGAIAQLRRATSS